MSYLILRLKLNIRFAIRVAHLKLNTVYGMEKYDLYEIRIQLIY